RVQKDQRLSVAVTLCQVILPGHPDTQLRKVPIPRAAGKLPLLLIPLLLELLAEPVLTIRQDARQVPAAPLRLTRPDARLRAGPFIQRFNRIVGRSFARWPPHLDPMLLHPACSNGRPQRVAGRIARSPV
ncbi:hypothetical protein, partial [Paraburkholderia sp. UYCP14C]|uniref:hypothetical protein n=1 Tax=Paraburkholderia sp. UYCP14C TaxID=2511130 RepID=UPI00145A0050